MDRAESHELAGVEVVVHLEEPTPVPPGATLILTLADVSRSDAPMQTLASRTIEPIGSLPASFTLRYDPERIVETHSYAVRATIRLGEALIHTTDRRHAVITRHAPTTVDVWLTTVGGEP